MRGSIWILILLLGGCSRPVDSNLRSQPVPSEANRPDPTKSIPQPDGNVGILELPRHPIIGTWKLVASSEDESTKDGIPDFLEWETAEFTTDGRKITSYKHQSSPEVFVSENQYQVESNKLTIVAAKGSGSV